MKVLLAASGSVSAVKVPEIALELNKFAQVRVVLTKAAEHFIGLCEKYDPIIWTRWKSFVDSQIVVYCNEDEWLAYCDVGKDPVLHIELRRWADILLIAPLSANTLAKLAQGICDNLVTSVARAWDLKRPVIVAPAMNTQMWLHPFTMKHLDAVKQLGYQVIPPIKKELACGDIGIGALANVHSIIQEVQVHQQRYNDDVDSAEVWSLNILSKSGTPYSWERSLKKLGTTESNLGNKYKVAELVDNATKVAFAYAVFNSRSSELRQVVNVGTMQLNQLFEILLSRNKFV